MFFADFSSITRGGFAESWAEIGASAAHFRRGEQILVNESVQTGCGRRSTGARRNVGGLEQISVLRPRVLSWEDAVEITAPAELVAQLAQHAKLFHRQTRRRAHLQPGRF